MNTQVVAYTPSELLASQLTVRDWCAENIRRLLNERKDAIANLEQAERSKFRTQPFRRVINRCTRRIEFYKKIGRAIKLGYMIVPNFDLDLFAVRTDARKPRHRTHRWRNNFVENGKPLPEGEGRYVDPVPFEEGETWTETNSEGREITKNLYWPTAFDEELTFPVEIVQPKLVKETNRALGYKLFDQVGVARGQYMRRRDDPIICGRIFDPTRADKLVTFFVAWWLDADMI